MEPKKTALYDQHVRSGAKMVEFADYLMPVQYTGIIEEHNCVREKVGLFDVSHMGEFFIRGDKAFDFLQYITLNDVSKLVQNKAQYTAMCFEHGGLVDDMILYCFGNHYMAIVNASNKVKDFEWMEDNLIPDVGLADLSDEYGLFAIQGRHAEATLQKLTDLDLSTLKYFWFGEGDLDGEKTFIARTGYTGEDGFEIAVSAEKAVKLWNDILSAGEEFGIQPIGLGARDTLRIEMTLCLYGNDIDETTNPIEAGLGWITKVDKGDFIGRDKIIEVKEAGAHRRLVGFEMKDKAVPRHGYHLVKDSTEMVYVTIGTFSTSLQKSIGIGYVETPYSEVGTEINVQVRNRELEAVVVKTPFYKRPY